MTSVETIVASTMAEALVSEDVRADVVCALNIGCLFRVLIQPNLAENGVPSPADEKINNYENPDDLVVDSNVHDENN